MDQASDGGRAATVGGVEQSARRSWGAVLELGFKVPEDISIAGYDDILISRLITPKLTTIAEPIKEMSQAMVNILIKKIHNKKAKNEDILLNTKLIIRDTVK